MNAFTTIKIFFVYLAAIAAFVFSADAQVDPSAVKISRVETNIVKTPEYQFRGELKRFDLGEWMEIEVEFETTPEVLPELTFKYTVLIEGKLLEGKVTHVNILQGREHHSVIYIEPRALKRLAQGKFVGANTAEGVWVEVSREGRRLATYPAPSKPMPKVPHVTGFILNKNQTPFAPLFYDRYEAIKVSP